MRDLLTRTIENTRSDDKLYCCYFCHKAVNPQLGATRVEVLTNTHKACLETRLKKLEDSLLYAESLKAQQDFLENKLYC